MSEVYQSLSNMWHQFAAFFSQNGNQRKPSFRQTFSKLPQKVERFMVKDCIELGNSLKLYIVEQDPLVRVTKWCFNNHYEDRVLSIPRMLHGILFFNTQHKTQFVDIYSFFLKEPYRDRNTRIYQTIFPNANSEGWVCIAEPSARDQLVQETGRAKDLNERISIVLRYFWDECAFNDHIFSHMQEHFEYLESQHPYFRSLASWEQLTREKPNFIYKINWRPAGNVQTLITRVRNRLEV